MVKKYGSTKVDTVIAKTAEYGVLKIRIPPMKDRYMHAWLNAVDISNT
jgi:hypothetical protein